MQTQDEGGVTQRGFTGILDRGFDWVLQHWLLFANLLVLLYGGLPWLAPLAFRAGYTRLGAVLFSIYTPLCHQKPAQSFFIGGYQMAFCQRETAMYTTLLLLGLLFIPLRDRIRPISLRTMGLLLLPMLLDGGLHLFEDVTGLAFRGSDALGSINFWLRIITGVLFAVAVVLAVYPRFERDVRAKPPMVAV